LVIKRENALQEQWLQPLCSCNCHSDSCTVYFQLRQMLALSSRAVVAGIDSEGLYRISGFHSDIEAVKLSLDKGVFHYFVHSCPV